MAIFLETSDRRAGSGRPRPAGLVDFSEEVSDGLELPVVRGNSFNILEALHFFSR